MNKKKRELVKNKFKGLCAYTGKPLDDKWQVDHVYPKTKFQYYNLGGFEDVNHIDNLLPAIRIVNHYKRGFDLEGFRAYMLTFHERLNKLPKKTSVEKTKKRIEYMREIASLFNIDVDKPFDGEFYFEKYNSMVWLQFPIVKNVQPFLLADVIKPMTNEELGIALGKLFSSAIQDYKDAMKHRENLNEILKTNNINKE